MSTVFEKPLSVCVGLGNQSQTLANILESQEFVYAYPNKHQLKDVIYCERISGRDTDKLKTMSLEFKPSVNIDVPILSDAVINFECRVVHTYDAGEFTIVIGQVEGYHSLSEYTLDKVYSLGGQRYGAIKDTEILLDDTPNS